MNSVKDSSQYENGLFCHIEAVTEHSGSRIFLYQAGRVAIWIRRSF